MSIADRLQEVTHGPRRWVLLEADCREVLPLIWPSSVRLLLTDAPYGISQEGAELTRRGSKALQQDFGPWDRLPVDDLERLIRGTLRAAQLAVESEGAAYVFTSDVLFGAVRQALVEQFNATKLGFLTWTKPNPAPSVRKGGWVSAAELLCWGRRPGNPFHYPGHQRAFNWMKHPAPSGLRRRHPTEKPLALLERIIRAQSAPGEVVLDTFAGGASTGEAALRLGRRFIGIELDATYAGRAHDHLTLVERALAVGAGVNDSAAERREG